MIRNLQEILRAVKRLRVESGLSQSESARAVGLDQGDWSKLERGVVLPKSLDRLDRMAGAVGMDLTLSLEPSKKKRRKSKRR